MYNAEASDELLFDEDITASATNCERTLVAVAIKDMVGVYSIEDGERGPYYSHYGSYLIPGSELASEVTHLVFKGVKESLQVKFKDGTTKTLMLARRFKGILQESVENFVETDTLRAF